VQTLLVACFLRMSVIAKPTNPENEARLMKRQPAGNKIAETPKQKR
jgi:hypothetical protein